MNIVDWITIIVLIAPSLAVAHLYVLGIFGILGRRRRAELTRDYRFLVLIPAHNEAEGIGRTLDSVANLERVGNLEVAVVADNCTDNTAEVAFQHGATVIERHDETNRGKGYALAYGIAQYDLDNLDGVAIIDADTIVAPNLLKEMARSFALGYGAVQVSNEFFIEKDTPLARLQEMANMVENVLFYYGRAVLRLGILLRGTGMGIRADVLNAHPWDSHSVTEDVDYAVNLLKAGVRIDFTRTTVVRSAATSSYEQSYSQKERWASGTFSLILGKLPGLIGTGLVRGRFELLELAFSLLILSRPTLIFVSLIPLVLSFFCSPDVRLAFLVWSIVIMLSLVVYILFGVFLVKDKRAAARALLHIPVFGIWLFVVQVKAFLKRKGIAWTRTERKTP